MSYNAGDTGVLLQQQTFGDLRAVNGSVVPAISQALQMIYLLQLVPVWMCVRIWVNILSVYRLAIWKSSMMRLVNSILPMRGASPDIIIHILSEMAYIYTWMSIHIYLTLTGGWAEGRGFV